MIGSPLLLIFVACFVYAIVESKHKWKTVLYTAIAMGFIVAVGVGIALMVPRMAASMGTIVGVIAPITGIFASIGHAKGEIA